MAACWALTLPTASSSSSSSSSSSPGIIIMAQHSVLTRHRIISSLRKPIRCASGRGASAVTRLPRPSHPPSPHRRRRPPPPFPARSSRWQKQKQKQQEGEELKKKDNKQKRRHWKEGEFPGMVPDSLVMSSSGRRKPPIKNIKKKMDDRLAAKAWVPTITETLSDKISNKQWQQALEAFDMLKEQPFYQPKEGTYIKLIVLLGKAGQAGQSQQLFDSMIEEGIEPTVDLYTALLAAYCRSRLIDGAFNVLKKMKNLPNCQPDVYTYSILIKACVDKTRFELVDLLFQEMSDRMITPNTVTQNTVLGGYGKAGLYDKMEKVLSAMLESDSCRPDVWTMNTILSLFGKKGQIDMMEKWYEKFRSIGIEPETRTFNILIGAYGKQRMYDKMTAVMEYMRKLEFPWTTSTYNNVIEAFADIGDSKHMEYTFNQMQGERMKPDTKTLCCLINGFSNAGLFHKVVDSVKLSEKLEVPRSTPFYNAVISACAKAGDLLEMEKVFKHMEGKAFSPDSITYAIMMEAYEKEGMSDKIYDLEQEVKQLSKDLPVASLQ